MSKIFKIASLAGDGIGPEVMKESHKILKFISDKYDHKFEINEAYVGGSAIDECGEALPSKTLKLCQESDAILFGSVGGPNWESLPPDKQPERASLLPLRNHFGLFANLRPAICFPELTHASPLKESKVEGGFDILCIRELTGGIYFGDPKKITEDNGEKIAIDTMLYKQSEIKRIAKIAFSSAINRNKKVTSIDKANVLQNGVLWRETVEEVSKEFTGVQLDHLYVDNAAMQLITRPKDFDVILASNLFGDILSDEMAMIAGSLGMLPSASLGELNSEGLSFGLYEQSGGSAPDIAGQGIANPIAQILSTAMMLRFSFDLKEEAELVENSVEKVIKLGYRTADIYTGSNSEKKVDTHQMGDLIIENI